MRVIAGKAKGITLETPKGKGIRPTQDRVREALFSILGARVIEARFLDLYAGTGANGIEALSRGASWCTFVDNDPRAIELIQRNLRRAQLGQYAVCLQATLPDALTRLFVTDRPYDLIFMGPPYRGWEAGQLFQALRDSGIIAAEALLILEHSPSADLHDEMAGFSRSRVAKYGKTCLSFFLDRNRDVW